MSNYVASYRRLDDNAARAESQAEEYRQRADHDRWEQCRIAHEAVDSGEYSRRSFAEAVGKSESTIRRQFMIWGRLGASAADARPTYAEALAVIDPSTDIENRRSAVTRGSVRSLPATEKAQLAAELLSDPDVEVAPSTIAKQAARLDVARAIARNDESREAVEEAGIEHRARHMPDDLPEPRAAGRRAGDSMARKLDTDLATAALRSAAGNVAEAILCRQEFGVRNPTEFAEALARLRHLVAAVEADDVVSDDDRGWLKSIGVEL